MKINEVLNKVTLKLPGGGKFPLSKYAPYITNVDEDVEDLGGGSELIEFKYSPTAYLAWCWFDSEDKAWEFRYRNEIMGENYSNLMDELWYKEEPIIVTEQDIKNQIELLDKVFGYTWNDPNGNYNLSLDLDYLYKENNIQLSEYLKIKNSIHRGADNEIDTMYTNIPYLLTEELNQEMLNDGNEYFSEEFIQKLANQGLYYYIPFIHISNYIDPNNIPNIDELAEIYNVPEIPQEWIDSHASDFESPMS